MTHFYQDCIGATIFFILLFAVVGCGPSVSTDDLQPLVAVAGNYAVAEPDPLPPAPEPEPGVCEVCRGTGKPDGVVKCPACDGTGKSTTRCKACPIPAKSSGR